MLNGVCLAIASTPSNAAIGMVRFEQSQREARSSPSQLAMMPLSLPRLDVRAAAT